MSGGLAENFIKDLILDVSLVFTILGYLGNLLSFIVFSSRSMRRHSISIYFRAIAVFDSICLIDGIYFFISKKFHVDMNTMSDLLCRTKSYFFYATGPIPAWLIVIVSADRFVSIGFPRRFQFLFKSSLQVIIILSIVIYNFSLYLFMILNIKFVKSNKDDYFFKHYIE